MGAAGTGFAVIGVWRPHAAYTTQASPALAAASVKVQADPSVTFVKSKVARISQDESGNPVCWGVNTEGYKRYSNPHDLVVLAVGMEPSVKGVAIPANVVFDSSGFIEADPANGGIFGAGCASNALDVNRAVQSATAAALRAIQVVNKVARAEA